MRVATLIDTFPSDLAGGAEYQSYTIARGLAGLGHDVTYVATGAGSDSRTEVEGVHLQRLAGRRLVGAQAHRRALVRALDLAAPDVCYVRSFPALATLAPILCELGLPWAFCASSLMESTPLPQGWRPDDWLAHLRSFLAMRRAQQIVTISHTMRRQVERWFPTQSITTIYNASPVPVESAAHQGTAHQIIWVNNLKKVKRPELLIALARRLPGLRFVMIGRQAEGRYGRWLHAVIEGGPRNLSYCGPQAIDTVNETISQSDLLLYTSRPIEGFGNSLIQAWLRGVPTVSLQHDPDGIICREGLGRCPQTLGEMAADIQDLMQDAALRAEMGRRARVYASRMHSLERMIQDYARLFDRMVLPTGGNLEARARTAQSAH